jgi:DNA-binding response OmpR family regulator
MQEPPTRERDDILVIDDDPAIVGYVVDALEDHGYAVRSAPDGREGLAAIQQRLPSLVLLDLMLPGLFGAPLMGKIWDIDPRLPIVLITAAPTRAAPLAAAHGLAWIAKPFDIETLLTCVGRYARPST